MENLSDDQKNGPSIMIQAISYLVAIVSTVLLLIYTFRSANLDPFGVGSGVFITLGVCAFVLLLDAILPKNG